VAVDKSLNMIRCVLPSRSSSVICADWCNLPISTAGVQAVVGDGCFTVLPRIAAYDELLQSIYRVLSPTGMFMMRFFVSPEIRESVNDVVQDLVAGNIGNFHVFKWRLAMALLDPATWSVSVHTVWIECDKITRAGLLPTWPQESIDTINVYRDSSDYYSFPPASILLPILSQYFEIVQAHNPEYELGDRCSTFLMRPLV
jgi:hypothetical protein